MNRTEAIIKMSEKCSKVNVILEGKNIDTLSSLDVIYIFARWELCGGIILETDEGLFMQNPICQCNIEDK